MNSSSQHPRGMILFFALLILGVTAASVILLLSQSSVNGYLSIDEKIKSEQVRAELYGCLDEALIHYAANPGYIPATITLASYTCSASALVSGDQRTVTISRTNLGITRRVVAVVNVNISPITISSVLEQ